MANLLPYSAQKGRYFWYRSLGLMALWMVAFALVAPLTSVAAEDSKNAKHCAGFLKGQFDLKEAQAWDEVRESVKLELLQFRRLSSDEKKQKLSHVSSEVMVALKALSGGKNIGFHFNLHGGRRDDYVTKGGIIAQMGDVAINYGASKDFNKKVYYFRSDEMVLADILNTKNPQLVFFRQRMGNVLILFNLEAPVLQEYRAQGYIKKEGIIFSDFDESRLRQAGLFVGVPESAFLMPPVTVFKNTKKLLGERSLTWDEETLATLRFLERYAAITAARTF